MSPRPQFIDLKRRFLETRKDENAEDAAVSSYAAYAFQRWHSFDWDELLKHPLVVIKGEPGSGKTWELEHQADLAAVSPYSFYLRLDEMSTASAPLPLREHQIALFSEWRQRNERAVFFLDSVDEAKLKGSSDFARALDNFRAALTPQERRRIQVVISTRITDFHHGTDEHLVRSCFPEIATAMNETPNGGATKSSVSFPYVVSLLPLDREAVETYANARLPKKAAAFIAAIDAAFAWDFARRPADVDDLLSYWSERGNLGTLKEILAFVCDAQLRITSNRDRVEVLSLERARTGAEFLAASTVFCRNFTFQIPGDSDAPADSLSASECLPDDWRADEIAALFNHAIFDGASYGRQRFHHRRLSEFLAARWLSGLMRRDCPIAELEHILFDSQSGTRCLRPTTGPVAAWLSAGDEWWNRQVRTWLFQAAPESLLRYGDPAQFSVEDRRTLLAALLAKAGNRAYLWWETDDSALSRLAAPELVPELNAILLSSDSGQGIRELAINIARAGGLKGCAD